MTLVLATFVALAIAAPHAVRLEQASPVLGATIWLAALLLRALTAVFAAIAAVLVLPTTQLFDMVTHWCWETVLPVLATQFGLDGHEVGDAALVLPALLLAASLVSVAFGLWRAARAVARLVQRAGVGHGPADSVILGDGEVVVAAAGLRRPRVLVSAGALTSFDDEELAASLEHERGHIQHRHRYVLVAGELCRALGRFLPGTRRAARELSFHLERDADRFALARDHEPAALASAICGDRCGRSGGRHRGVEHGDARHDGLNTHVLLHRIGGSALDRAGRSTVGSRRRVGASTSSQMAACRTTSISGSATTPIATVSAAVTASAATSGRVARIRGPAGVGSASSTAGAMSLRYG